MIIGAGASGLMAAIHAARGGASVTVLEHMPEAGKKLLMTGNGKCNYTNTETSLSHYHSLTDEKGTFISEVLSGFTPRETIEFFREIGIVPRVRSYGYDEGGYVYPASGEARSVREALLSEADAANVKIVTDCRTRSVMRIKNKEGRPFYRVDTTEGIFSAESLIFAGGAAAFPKTGSDGRGYELAAAFGHMVWQFLPALCALRCVGSFFKDLKGVRTLCALRLEIAPPERSIAEERAAEHRESEADHFGFLRDSLLKGPYECRGEVQFTDYGLSGIPAFQLSRYAALAVKLRRERYIVLDLVPDMTEDALLSELQMRRERFADRTIEHFLNGLLPEKLARVVLARLKLRRETGIYLLEDETLLRICSFMKGWRIGVLDTNGFDSCQCCAGGVDTREIDPKTMESRLMEELFFAGELVDVDADCGGYNLQWAWSSGAVAGRAAAKIRRYGSYPDKFSTNAEGGHDKNQSDKNTDL